MDEAGKGLRPRGGFQSGGRFSGSRGGRGGRGYSRGTTQHYILQLQFILNVVLIGVLNFYPKEAMVETGAMEKGVMATEAMGAMTGALVAAVATEVEDIHLVVTETTGKNLH